MIGPYRVRTLAGAALGSLALLAATASVGASAPRAADYVPDEVVVGYTARPAAAVTAQIERRLGIRAEAGTPAAAAGVQILRLPPGVSVRHAIARLRDRPGIAYAVPNYIAHADGSPWIPNNPGRAHRPGGWQAMQWNFLAAAGVDAPDAWANLIADQHPGARGVTIAILDTGVAYRNWHRFKKSPGFRGTRFVDPYDFVADNRYPLDRNGHGTLIAGIIAEATNDGYGLTGLAYGASIMPVRVLDASGNGDAGTIARGIRYAVNHRAKVINLSLEFDPTVRAAEIPELITAIRYAQRRGVVVVAATGNDASDQLAYPAADPAVISVGASTRDRCLADYSNHGHGLDLVAPGGGDDADLPADPDCHPGLSLPPIYQLTLTNPSHHPGRFGYPGDYYGTSMAAAHVAATAAMVIASQLLGAHPTPNQILARLEQTAQPLGGAQPSPDYGYGLLDAGAATTPPPPVVSTRRP